MVLRETSREYGNKSHRKTFSGTSNIRRNNQTGKLKREPVLQTQVTTNKVTNGETTFGVIKPFSVDVSLHVKKQIRDRLCVCI
ncbi:hypothetical protein ACF0H5_020129 [Mactra antiquata]